MSIFHKTTTEIKEIINKHLPVNDKQKQQHGEVFTPLFYLEQMLETLPNSVWSNPNLKWLDPANGIGNFPMLIFEKLMTGLAKKIPNKQARAKHIVENMLYMVEIDERNVKISRQIFGPNANIYQGSFMEYPKLKQFDIIVGNPPYNEGGTKSHGIKNIYVAFVQESLRILSPGGYLLFIHPSNWRTPKKIKAAAVDLNDVYTHLSIRNVIMYPQPKIIKDMGIMMSLDVVLVQNRPFSGEKTKVTDIYGKTSEVVIHPNSLIPNYGADILEKMARKVREVGKHVNLVRNSEAHKQFTTPGKYKNIHGIVKKGVRVCSSKDKHSDTNTPKLLINGIGSHNYVFYDAYGHYGFTQNMVAVLKPSPKTKILIRSKLFQYLANATKIIGNNFNIATENYLPLFNRSENIKTSQDLYDYFGFSAEEIKEIERRPFLLYENKFIGCSKKKRDVSSSKKTRKKRD